MTDEEIDNWLKENEEIILKCARGAVQFKIEQYKIWNNWKKEMGLPYEMERKKRTKEI